MTLRYYLVALATLSTLTSAWLPVNNLHRLVDRDGFSRFDRQTPASSKGSEKRWWIPSGKIRGVNLGSLFVFEPWIAHAKWEQIGCGGQQSEFDCVKNTGQNRSDAAFQGHWDTWITAADLDEMKAYGINTIRIPVGYWMKEDLVDRNTEYFPKVGPITPRVPRTGH
jgi:glucan endo-1,6-beta-glucosidase